MKKGLNKTILIFAIFVSSLPSNSQDITDIMAEESCDCISKQDLNKYTSYKQLEMALGICLIQSFSNHEKQAKKELKLDINNENDAEKIGEMVGVKMAFKCPLVFTKVSELQNPQEDQFKELSGKIKDIKFNEFAYIILQEEEGRSHEFIWLRYFEGSDDFQNNHEKYVGKNATIMYEEIECYAPKIKEYLNKKEIREIIIEDEE
ncbi:MAG TPA: hypothetical protein VD908_01010 [Cytophagales bacterium]|nr:hypothetical protein [Cytophagales bacterium]